LLGIVRGFVSSCPKAIDDRRRAIRKRFNELGSTPADEAEINGAFVRKMVEADIARYKVTLATKD
jgi:hypothetical protein